MSYVPRTYEEIVRDMLTTLTGGTVRESVTAPAGDVPIILEKLQNRPVRRISHLEGTTVVGAGATARDLPYRFTSADFELVSTTGDDTKKDSIRFRKGGRPPKAGTQLTVNYYPVETERPVPLTDLNVGSVVRTLMETVAREMAMAYLQMEHIYDSAFLDTAEGSSLDKVAALVGVRRIPAGYPVARLRFTRRADAGAGLRAIVPANTPVVDDSGARYLTMDTLTLEPGESTREVNARGESPGTKLVAEDQLSRMEVRVAGVSEVTNPQPARSLTTPETDGELRRRTAACMHGVVRGTYDALKFGLLSIDGVKNVNIMEMPNGIPGEVRIEIAQESADPDRDGIIERTIQEIRPAGIRVTWGKAAGKRVALKVALTLGGSGSGVTGGVLSAINSAVEASLRQYLTSLPPGGKARRAQMVKLVLDDARITDAQVTLAPQGEGETDELQLPADTVAEVTAVTFSPPAYEVAGGAAATVAQVSAYLPIHLVAGVTLVQATGAINAALDTFLAGRGPSNPLDVDRLAAAIQDDTRFGLVRNETVVTVEGGGRFLQLTDGVGLYALAPNERLQKGEVTIEPREGTL